MQFPESWLRTFCNPPLNTQQLADTLTMAGLEVEALDPVAPPFSGIVVGHIIEVAPHPNADRLRVCQVDVGQASHLSIVCGAPNARPGIKVPCATVGAELPPSEAGASPWRIKLGKLRGVESQGMLCSAKELGISNDQDGLLELGSDAIPGTDLRVHLNLDDTLFTLKLTPNLAHCLSIYGVARELSALTATPLMQPEFPVVAPAHTQTIPVRIEATDLCGRFSGRVVKGVNPQAKTPDWMVQRLARCGQRSVNPLVDISNYVMFELGRPSHIFDLDKIHGQVLHVRWACQGETLELLNGNTVTLDKHVGVIADQQSVESLAGIMGGQSTAVSDETRNIYIEAAFWWPKAIAGRSRRYNFSTDAGHRFERGVDPSHTVEHIERITELVLAVCGGEAGPITDDAPNVPQASPVRLRVARAAKVIGMPLTQTDCADALRKLGLTLTEDDGVITVVPPSYRFDLQIEEDLIEEVARMIGYDRLPTTPPHAPTVAHIRLERQRGPFSLRRQMAELGYQETINFSFIDAQWEAEVHGCNDPIRLLNPITSQMSVMRSSLIASLLQVLKFNVDRKNTRACVFELGRVFHKNATAVAGTTSIAGFEQPMRLGAALMGEPQGLTWHAQTHKSFDFFDAKGHIERLLAPRQADFAATTHPAFHPGRCAQVSVDGQCIGVVGELHPKLRQSWGFQQAPIVFELDLESLLQWPVPAFKAFSKQQAVERDIAIWLKEHHTYGELMTTIQLASTDGLLQQAALFDIYRPVGELYQGEKSMAVRLVFKRDDTSLTDVEIDAAVNSIVQHLSEQLGARLRG
jgi:phenylalanyl-tRNA synthetase beta chain